MATDLSSLLEEANTLRQNLNSVLSQTSPEVVEEEILKRKRFQAKLRENKALQRKMIAAYEEDMRNRARQFREQQDMTLKMIDEAKGIIRDIDTENGWLTADLDELSSLKWELIRDRKSLNS